MLSLTVNVARRLFFVPALCIQVALLVSACRPAGAQDAGQFTNQASFVYTGPDGQPVRSLLTSKMMLVDPRGQVRGCSGGLLADYRGFTVGLYETDAKDPGNADLKTLVPLTPTGPAGGGLPVGIEPNTANTNPFPLSNSAQGMFSFLLDPGRGQLATGRNYVLLLQPPAGSDYRQRRVLISIGAMNGALLTYTATSIDGEPISGTDGRTNESRAVVVQDAAHAALSLTALNLGLTDCAARPLEITKTGDRAAAAPGDTVIYRVRVRNGGTLPLVHVAVTDTLPVGFDLRADSVRAQVEGASVTLTVDRKGRVTTFSLPPGSALPVGQTLSIAYGALLTPSALRGNGQNAAGVSAETTMTMGDGQTMTQSVSDGPAVYGVQVRDGLLSDTGTLLGRVFEDLNADGEQQPGEPGIPNVTVVLDDSTEVVSDVNGLFSVPTLTAGYHTAVLDFRSAPGYVLAPNRRFLERRTPARLVHLEPGGLARVSFGLKRRK